MIKYVIPAAIMLASTAAQAAVVVLSEVPVYRTDNVYETVEVCTKGDDKTTEGAIVGGLLGSESGNAGLGAIIGAIIGDSIGEEKCTTERRVVGSTKTYIGKDVMIEIDGVTYTVQHRVN